MQENSCSQYLAPAEGFRLMCAHALYVPLQVLDFSQVHRDLAH